jgi:hypothetical protein
VNGAGAGAERMEAGAGGCHVTLNAGGTSCMTNSIVTFREHFHRFDVYYGNKYFP